MSTLQRAFFVHPSSLAHLSMLNSNSHQSLILQRQLVAIKWKIPLSQILMDNFVAFAHIPFFLSLGKITSHSGSGYLVLASVLL